MSCLEHKYPPQGDISINLNTFRVNIYHLCASEFSFCILGSEMHAASIIARFKHYANLKHGPATLDCPATVP